MGSLLLFYKNNYFKNFQVLISNTIIHINKNTLKYFKGLNKFEERKGSLRPKSLRTVVFEYWLRTWRKKGVQGEFQRKNCQDMMIISINNH